eukprot:85286-Ditylum_brightwellii.AAC.1
MTSPSIIVNGTQKVISGNVDFAALREISTTRHQHPLPTSGCQRSNETTFRIKSKCITDNDKSANFGAV